LTDQSIKMKPLSTFIIGSLILLGIWACKAEHDTINPKNGIEDESNSLLGGKLTVFDQSENAFGNQVPGLDASQSDIFVVGNSFFRNNWVTAPASTTARDGLGAFFNAKSCGSCHGKDGRGMPPSSGSPDMHSLLFRIGIEGNGKNGEPLAHPEYGGQIQSSAILGLMPEAQPNVQYIDFEYTYPDGEKVSLRKPQYTFNFYYESSQPNFLISPRVGLQLCGMGLLEAIAENDILKNADIEDADKDGISGKPNYVWSVESQTKKLGRFGWKANQPSLKQQVAGAFNGDIGITSSLFPQEDYPKSFEKKFSEIANGGSPEISDQVLDQVTFYCQTLAVPAARKQNEPNIKEGKALFINVGCVKCHIENFKTMDVAVPSVLSNIHLKPYTDMLLHDMGNGLADERPDFEANGNEWRTSPLWGIGLIKTVNKHTFLLHDGRARNIEEAILWHAGEANKSKEMFSNLKKEERQKILDFVNSL
jgi:CxxC motif-containing protein (DUF1111 family)